MDDKTKIGLVETHPQGNGSHQDFHFVVQQSSFKFLPVLIFQFCVVCRRVDIVFTKPHGHPFRIPDGESVDNSASGKRGYIRSQPCHPFNCITGIDVAESQAPAGEGSPCKFRANAYLPFYILHDPVVGRSSSCKDRNICGHGLEHAYDPFVIRAKIVPPVGNAVSLVNDEHPDRLGDR